MTTRHTLAFMSSLVALAGAGFFAGWQWPKTLPPLEFTVQPEREHLRLQYEQGDIIGTAPRESTLMFNQTVVRAGEEFRISLDKAFPLKLWNDKWTVILELPAELPAPIVSSDETQQTGNLVASKSGKKYHPSEGCHYVDSIKPENKIFFSSEAEAKASGYEPSSCFDN